ncbi:MAG TPA: deoxyribodipyrimidine photo-lyase [Magnetospirillum sp.]|nr:deoxyribodipyrimidine photo-lyase [Magnetospirillum sp.]
MSPTTTLVWLRQDLRLSDHPALAAAPGPVVLAFVLDDNGPWRPGGASRWWLHHSLRALGTAVAAKGGRLVLLRGDALSEIPRLAAELNAGAVHWNRRWEPGEPEREAELSRRLSAAGIQPRAFAADLLFEPGSVRTKTGQPYQVFTPFWRAALALPEPPRPLPAPAILMPPPQVPDGLSVDALGLMPTIPWWQGMAETWQPGEAGARANLTAFLDDGLDSYDRRRDRPDQPGTSMLSPHLAFGEISPRQIWHAVRARPPGSGADTFLKELGWREFSHSLIATFPDLATQPLQPAFAAFPWHHDEAAFAAWTRGRTGFPIVDAGMRQLWATGWMHNRVRMIVGSFLVKDLLLPWQQGERWFWDTLVDANAAANAASWQWIAGCGADAAPYFRVFNPVTQGEKFDPSGAYVRRWVPELAGLPDQYVHQPWQAPPLILAGARVKLGITYPAPMVDHGAARLRALAAYGEIKGGQ